jgi:hypothetical protein
VKTELEKIRLDVRRGNLAQAITDLSHLVEMQSAMMDALADLAVKNLETEPAKEPVKEPAKNSLLV